MPIMLARIRAAVGSGTIDRDRLEAAFAGIEEEITASRRDPSTGMGPRTPLDRVFLHRAVSAWLARDLVAWAANHLGAHVMRVGAPSASLDDILAEGGEPAFDRRPVQQAETHGRA